MIRLKINVLYLIQSLILFGSVTTFRLNSEAYCRYLHFQSLQYQERNKRGW